MTDLKKQIREAIWLLLEEESDDKKDDGPNKPDPPKDDKKGPKPDKKSAKPGSIQIAKGSTGRGRFTGFVGAAGARSKKDPKGLMEDLGVKSAKGSTDIEKVKSVLRVATSYNATMREAFAGATSFSFTEGANTVKGVKVSVKAIKRRDGIKFLSHTLTGAKNADVLDLESAIEIGVQDNDIFIQQI